MGSTVVVAVIAALSGAGSSLVVALIQSRAQKDTTTATVKVEAERVEVERDALAWQQMRESIAELRLRADEQRDALEASRLAFDAERAMHAECRADIDLLSERIRELEASVGGAG